AEDGIRDDLVTGVQTCALPIFGFGYSPLAAGLRILVWMAMPMLVAPVAGALADRIGNRPFMVAGLTLQAAGLGWLAAVVSPGVRSEERRVGKEWRWGRGAVSVW